MRVSYTPSGSPSQTPAAPSVESTVANLIQAIARYGAGRRIRGRYSSPPITLCSMSRGRCWSRIATEYRLDDCRVGREPQSQLDASPVKGCKNAELYCKGMSGRG